MGQSRISKDDVLDCFSENPIILTRIDGHSLWTNKAAISQSTYTDELICPHGGEIINRCITVK